ncbi:MAG TPA: hypothetical protein VIJ85_09980 [Rhizomicrobium sp.]
MDESSLSQEEIARRRDAAIRRAMNAPPKPNSAYIGKGKRAKAPDLSRVSQSDPKAPKADEGA